MHLCTFLKSTRKKKKHSGISTHHSGRWVVPSARIEQQPLLSNLQSHISVQFNQGSVSVMPMQPDSCGARSLGRQSAEHFSSLSLSDVRPQETGGCHQQNERRQMAGPPPADLACHVRIIAGLSLHKFLSQLDVVHVKEQTAQNASVACTDHVTWFHAIASSSWR